jgi:hypothetical protein
MFASDSSNVVAYRRKQHKAKVWIIRLIIEAWELLLLSTIQVALNSFNVMMQEHRKYPKRAWSQRMCF